jgi:hypothetical protein
MTADIPTGPIEGDPIAVWITVTPELAVEWLDGMADNRKLSKRHVDAWVRDIQNGNAHQNHQGFGFSWDTWDGRWHLFDGQHRCAAIIETGVPVRVLCTFGADSRGVDRVRVRTFGDQLRIDGEAQHNQLAAAARLITVWLALGQPPRSGSYFTPTEDEMRETLAAHPCIAATLPLCDQIRRGCGLRASVAGWFRFATAHTEERNCKSPDDDWFLERLVSGDELNAVHPALTLRNRIIADRNFAKDVFRLSAGCVYAWNAYREGRELAIIKVPGGLTPATFPEVR